MIRDGSVLGVHCSVQSGKISTYLEKSDKMAQQIAKSMLDSGLISSTEFNKLSDINLETFSPLFVEIYPKNA